ncbi:exported hypothetical protein [uncultured Stenotrophomonas sp.]|uniref:Uncharacterized protein n=1 Tax=uncultured Stenotrophomonas sp. TaxID=165438 RepID=A0A1Y5Q125_9GAMM|nr:exported hypothetical protein [uncultured Stenotrophomonas sp.]
MMAILLLLSALCLSIGTARLFAWCLDYREARIEASYRAECMVALARAEVCRG